MLMLAVMDCGDNGDGLITVCDFGSYRILMYVYYIFGGEWPSGLRR